MKRAQSSSSSLLGKGIDLQKLLTELVAGSHRVLTTASKHRALLVLFIKRPRNRVANKVSGQKQKHKRCPSFKRMSRCANKSKSVWNAINCMQMSAWCIQDFSFCDSLRLLIIFN